MNNYSMKGNRVHKLKPTMSFNNSPYQSKKLMIICISAKHANNNLNNHKMSRSSKCNKEIPEF